MSSASRDPDVCVIPETQDRRFGLSVKLCSLAVHRNSFLAKMGKKG